ncbi:MAG TPA: alpha/beta fold hydrolase, partial [Candidatus Binatia bacterium]
MTSDLDLQINLATYQWSVRIFSILKRFLRVNLELYRKDSLESGEIFLFNHFARFETFIPQYLIYRETGAFCRSVAASDFFKEQSAFTHYLLSVGAVPNNYPRLLPFLAEEILRGRKVIIFPEGGMVKDRRVLDQRGRYRVYSRSAHRARKHHSGAAVLALAVEALKRRILRGFQEDDLKAVEGWSEILRLDKWALLAAVHRPTVIVPSNITFYPIRVNDNLLRKVAELLRRGLSRRVSEELLIEGNILLKHTDMDVRLGDPLEPQDLWRWWDRGLITHLTRGFGSVDEFYGLGPDGRGWQGRLLGSRLRHTAEHVRDRATQRMYAAVTVNLSHLASRMILASVDEKAMEIDRDVFHRALYLGVKKIQKERAINLHASLCNPEDYSGLTEGRCSGLEQFLKTATEMGLVETDEKRYRFLPKLRQEHEIDEIRLENLVVVYANEAAPVANFARLVEEAKDEAATVDEPSLARLRFDDELVAHRWDKQTFSLPRYGEINAQETVTEDSGPFLFPGRVRSELGVVLVHGLLASPAEVRSFGEKLKTRGFPVMGVRLKGHGTSPWDLRERSWQDWLESVRRGYGIMSGLARRVALVGFSSGGALALRLAAGGPEGLAGVVAVCAPVKLRDRNMVFVPLLHGANQVLGWMPAFEGIMPFRSLPTAHPHINYRNVPIRCLYELRLMIDEIEGRMQDVHCPVTLMQATEDPVVDPRSAHIIYGKLGSVRKEIVMVEAERHGILYEDIDHTQDRVV